MSIILWRKNIIYIAIKNVVIFSILFFSSSILLTPEVKIEINKLTPLLLQDAKILNTKLEALINLPEMQNLVFKFLLLVLLLQPLQVGLLECFKKTRAGEPRSVKDLFRGYMGADFFRYLSYFVIYSFLDGLASTHILLRLLLMLVTFLVLPIMHKYRLSSFAALSISLRVFSKKTLIILGVFAIAGLLNWSGIVFFGLGLVFTLGISTAVAYATTEHFVKIEISDQNFDNI